MAIGLPVQGDRAVINPFNDIPSLPGAKKVEGFEKLEPIPEAFVKDIKVDYPDTEDKPRQFANCVPGTSIYGFSGFKVHNGELVEMTPSTEDTKTLKVGDVVLTLPSINYGVGAKFGGNMKVMIRAFREPMTPGGGEAPILIYKKFGEEPALWEWVSMKHSKITEEV